MIVKRKELAELKALLEKRKWVLLYGRRKVGKTVLAKMLNPDKYYSISVR